MKRILLIVLVLITYISNVQSQNELEAILWSSNTYEEIVAEGEAYFKKKHPNINLNKLAGGENRDSEYVKFMRWQSFWENSLNPDGTLANIGAKVEAAKSKKELQKSSSPYENVTWTNISYNDYIISQIGLGRTTSIGFHPTDPNTFYVGAAIGGIWRTTDGGQTYTPLGDELPFLAVSSIIVHKNTPSTIFIAISDHVWYGPPSIGIYKSTDGGTTWSSTALDFDFEDNIRVYWMEADPNNPDKMFVATSDGLYQTNNQFSSVTKVNNVSTFDVKINPANSNIVYQAGRNGEFYRSTDGGNNFSFITDFGNGEVYTMTTTLNGNKVYAINGSTLHKSTNSGASFNSSNALSTNTGLFVFSPTNQNTLIGGYVGVDFPTERSDNGGASFYLTSQWLGNNGLPSIHVDQRNIFTNPLQNDYVYYCNDGGVYRYVISTNSFENLCNGLQITQFYDIAVSQTNAQIIGGGSQDNGNVFRNANGVWDDYAPTGDGMNQDIDPTNENVRYWAYQNGSLHRWENGNNTYIAPFGKSGAWETPFKLDPNNSNRIVAGYDKVYSSTNRGNSWTDISGSTNFGGNLNEIAIAKSNSNRIYTSRDNQLFVKSTTGNTWTQKSMPGTAVDLEVDPLNMDVVYMVIAGYINGSKVYKSIDAGSNWTNITGSLPNVSADAIELYEDIEGAIFVGTDAGVYYRDDTQSDWVEYGNLPNTRVDDIEIQYAAQLIRVGTHGRGVLEAPIAIETCDPNDPDSDNDGICDANDTCPNFDNNLIGTPCDDGNPNTSGETYQSDCSCGGGSSNLNYCSAEGSSGTGADWISRVRLNTLDHSSAQSMYSDFTDQSTTLQLGSTHTLTVDLNFSFALDEVYAWIDYDKDGTFEASELINMSDISSNHQSQGTVSVPTEISAGVTTMRVRVIYADPNPADPCGSYFGEVEDYTIVLEDSCPDQDNDGICDDQDVCPNLDDNLIGTPCDDGNPNTSGETYQSDCSCGGGSSNLNYCSAEGSSGTGADWISRVRLNTLDHSSAQSMYSDFTDQSTTLQLGSTHTLTVDLNFSFALDEVYAWIDYDKDGTFEASELINMSDISSNHQSQGTVNVPTGISTGNTTMRVRVIYADPNPADPCGSYFGEVEDYTIVLEGSCPDQDNDGICDDQDVCPNLDDNLIGTPCDDGNPNTSGETYQSDCSCGGGSSNLTYCSAEGSSGTGGDWIRRVRLNTLDHSSAQSMYSDFTDQSTTLGLGSSHTLTVDLNFSFALDEVYAWIDYDRDGTFEASELINMSDINSNHQSQGTVNVPIGINTGGITMRVRVIYADPNPADPCGSYFGEVEDYTIVLESCNDADNDGVCDAQDVCNGYSDSPLILTTNHTSSADFLAVDEIESSAIAESSITVDYEAGQLINLKNGFHAINGSAFRAFINDCTTTSNSLVSDEENEFLRTQEIRKQTTDKINITVFPNPFDGQTNIRYDLLEDGPVQLIVTDMNGRLLDILLNTSWQAAGTHQLYWQSPFDFSGILLLQLKTKDQVAIRKIVLR